MKIVNFLKAFVTPILIALGTAVVLIVGLFIQSTMADRRDIPAAQEAGQNVSLTIQLEMLTTLSYDGGASAQMTPEIARQTMEENLQSIIDANNGYVSELRTDIDAASANGSEALGRKIDDQSANAYGIYGSMDQSQYEAAMKKSTTFVEEMMHEFTRAATESQSLMDMYKSRMDWLTSNSEMSSTEIFELARQSNTNLFIQTNHFYGVVTDLGLDATGLNNLEVGLNLGEGPLDDVAGDNSKSFEVLINSLGSFFNACNQC